MKEIEKITCGDKYLKCECSDEKYFKKLYYCPNCGNILETLIQEINIQYKTSIKNIHIEINMNDDKISIIEK